METKYVLGMLLFGLMGIFLCLGGAVWWHRGYSSTHWPAVQGTIETSEILYGDDGNDSHVIVYQYKVGDHPYRGDRIGYKTYLASSVTRRYPVGREVDVYYKPDEPSIAVLEPGEVGGAYILFVFGGCFILLSALIGYSVHRRS